MKAIIVIARIVMAFVYLIYGLNFFLHFYPASLPPGKAGDLEGGLIRSDYFFQYMKSIQIAGSLLLFTNQYIPLSLVILFPISLNIFLFHIFLLSKGLGVAILLLTANTFLLFAYRKYYQSVLVRGAFL
jgi:putative oxidoreductase